MKKIKGKYIRLTESQLHSIIKENVERILQEYAEPRNKYIDKISSYFCQIAENWCLIHYCTLSNIDVNNCKNHWKQELKNILVRCASYKLKGNNDYSHRKKAIYESEEYGEILTDAEVCDAWVKEKFEKEKIVFNDDNIRIYNQCLTDLIQNKDTIIHIIANFDKNEIIEYVNKI